MSQNQQQLQPQEGHFGADDALAAGGQVQASAVDDILDDIDAVLEANAAAFVQGFVQKGGQ
ncbi:Bacterial ubiquitin-like modifier [Actinomyces bovis]|uniref:Prokaryotic ubiquitin-like protein Pup n=1 Tax=Actinomyces bovis TaxID=1658 RepID=A0ABY1VL43_9ACTO|nr:ubiquitin-like protein Pup [Actinomyces bovis]SPT52401.1 Bacterial ubiquitin-like modifier [Actinomyces bovis]VEG54010.1 Bacterial ubiquitin-like modifier [Actinomyces israelii]